MAAPLRIFETRDYHVIHAICSEPSIWPWIHDDHVTNPKTWTPTVGDSLRFLIAADSQGPCGFGAFLAMTWTCWDGHFGFLPRAYGDPAVEAFRRMLEWMWQHTSAQRIVGEIVKENRRAIGFAKRAGFKQYGVNERSYLRDGVLRDQVCLGISKPEDGKTV